METKNLILRDIDWNLDQQDLHYISQKPYGKLQVTIGSLLEPVLITIRLPVSFKALGRVKQQLGSHASVFAVDLKCPQGLVLAGPLSTIAIIIADEKGLLFISSKDVESYKYEFEVLGLIEKELGAHESLLLEKASHDRVLSSLQTATPQGFWQ
ncbi:hypothetical protein KXW65_002238 [Aspergillus fumigatus]|nr:hypothetical protein KXX63_001767 [Aspergillus fumigatus]KAH1452025.1 hypothetical protein KXX58_003577 [Aspergillus fumigatus]KAH1806391.1 hypothetical protein KXX19_002801 [Aspergillus fumigatus]KAH2098329.1 hypothetical protein KXW65_002238 [Aspergillus fumigatus]KAH2254952.1 hypothetical protein KXW26_001689 [Aspergillus fumigatus]